MRPAAAVHTMRCVANIPVSQRGATFAGRRLGRIPSLCGRCSRFGNSRTSDVQLPLLPQSPAASAIFHHQSRRQRHAARRGQHRLCAALDPDNASIMVAGGGGIALDVTQKLKDMGAWVWMLQRSDSRRAEIEGMMAIVVRGDALDPHSVEAAFAQVEEVDAVVSTIGGTPADPSADSEGNINLIKSAIRKGVRRFVLVTSIGTGDSRDAPPQQVYDVLEKVLLEKSKAEDYLKAHADGMEFTIVRPGGLKSEPATGQGVLTEDTSVCGAVHREDVAQLVVQALFSDKAANKVLSAVDKSQLMGDPTFREFLLR